MQMFIYFNPGIPFRSCIVPNLIAFFILSLFSLQSLFQVGPHLTRTSWRVPGLAKKYDDINFVLYVSLHHHKLVYYVDRMIILEDSTSVEGGDSW